jgi:hypothetical protein
MFEPLKDPGELALPESRNTFDFSAGYEILAPRILTGRFGLSFMHASFSKFVQPAEPGLASFVGSPITYVDPKYTLLLIDLAAHIVPHPQFPLDFYGLFTGGMSIESYTIVYTVPATLPPAWVPNPMLENGVYTRIHAQAGLGLGIRAFVMKGLSLSAEYKWLFGEARTTKLVYDHEDQNYIYYREGGWDLKGPTTVFSVGISYLFLEM